MALTLKSDIVGNGVDQGSLVDLLTNIKDVLNEIQADHATTKTTVDGLVTAVTELMADHATNKTFTDELKTDLNALKTDLGTIATKLDSDGGVTDTNYAAQIVGTTVASSGAATLSASVPSAGPATLTNSTAITLLRG